VGDVHNRLKSGPGNAGSEGQHLAAIHADIKNLLAKSKVCSLHFSFVVVVYR